MKNFFHGCDDKVLLLGEEENMLGFCKIYTDNCDYKLGFYVQSNWFMSYIDFYISKERVNEFFHGLFSPFKKINFINEDGNFDMDINIIDNGMVNVSGQISKNMMDDLYIKFGFDTYMLELDNFRRNFITLL